jgi:putative redox protein
MVDIHISYEGELRSRAKHGPSGVELITDAPVDNHGKGESFSPTDLLATALGTCMITVMGIFATKRGIELGGTKVHVKKLMTKEPPRRVARLECEIAVPESVAATVDGPTRAELVRIAETCPVRLSILPAIEVPLDVRWGGAGEAR